MQLTDQMKAEINGIKKHMDEIQSFKPTIQKEILEGRLTPISGNYMVETSKQLSSHKVRLENLLCETDIKERD